MRIESVAVALPSRRVTNQQVIEKIAHNSPGFTGLKIIERTLQKSGSNTRTWLGSGETSLGLTVQACRKAIAEVGKDKPIDLLIVASVYPELVEPSTANIVARELGLNTVECFDLKEACDGWMKAVKFAEAFISSGRYQRVLVVNDEFSLTSGYAIDPVLFTWSGLEQMEWRFPSLTIGEAATATILGPDPKSHWRFSNTTRNDLFDLCTVTPSWYGKNPIDSHRVAKDGPGIFSSYGAELREHGLPLIVEEFNKSGINPDEVDILFTHSSSKSDWAEAARRIGLEDKIYDIYATCGNVVSAAVPAAMALAVEEGKLKRGDRVVVLVASAGMSFSLAQFKF